MIQTTVAARYAEALFAIAKQNNTLEQLENELRIIDQVLEDNLEFKKLLNHPHIDKQAKKGLLLGVFKGHISEVTENFVQLLIDKKRQNVFTYIVKEFTLLANEARGIVDAVVVSAKVLSDKQLEQIRTTFKELVGKDLRIATEVDAEIIGGFIVRIGDRVYDSSLKTQLNRFEAKLHEAQVGR